MAGYYLTGGNNSAAQEILFRRDRFEMAREVEKALQEYAGESGAQRLQHLFPLTESDAAKLNGLLHDPFALAEEFVRRFSPRWLLGWRDHTHVPGHLDYNVSAPLYWPFGIVRLQSYDCRDESNNQLIRIMENPTHPQSQHSDSDSDRAADRDSQPQDKSQPQPGRPAFDALRDALRRGAEDARTAAEKAIPKVKSAAADAVYWTTYGVSFAAVFQWTLAKGLAPESLKSGCCDGVKAGREAAEKWIEKLRHRKEMATDGTPYQAGPSADAVQPGAA